MYTMQEKLQTMHNKLAKSDFCNTSVLCSTATYTVAHVSVSHSYIQTCTHTYMHTYRHTYRHACIPTTHDQSAPLDCVFKMSLHIHLLVCMHTYVTHSLVRALIHVRHFVCHLLMSAGCMHTRRAVRVYVSEHACMHVFG